MYKTERILIIRTSSKQCVSQALIICYRVYLKNDNTNTMNVNYPDKIS